MKPATSPTIVPPQALTLWQTNTIKHLLIYTSFQYKLLTATAGQFSHFVRCLLIQWLHLLRWCPQPHQNIPNQPHASSWCKLLPAVVGHKADPVSIFQRVRLYAVTHNYVYDFSRCSYISPSPACSCNTSDCATHINVYFKKFLTSGYKDSVLKFLQEQTQINGFKPSFPYTINKCIFLESHTFILVLCGSNILVFPHTITLGRICHVLRMSDKNGSWKKAIPALHYRLLLDFYKLLMPLSVSVEDTWTSCRHFEYLYA